MFSRPAGLPSSDNQDYVCPLLILFPPPASTFEQIQCIAWLKQDGSRVSLLICLQGTDKTYQTICNICYPNSGQTHCDPPYQANLPIHRQRNLFLHLESPVENSTMGRSEEHTS